MKNIKTLSKINLELTPEEPLYKSLARSILQCLAIGEWAPGECLPSESELASRFGVSVFTIRAGTSELVSANLLVRKQGKGTFVTLHSKRPERYQFFRIFRNDGSHAFSRREIISFKKLHPNQRIAELLKLNQSSQPQEIFQFSVVLKAKNLAFGLSEIMVPATLFKQIRSADLQNSEDNFYALYQEKFGINVISVEERVHAVKACKQVANLLKITLGEPVLQVNRTAYTFNDVPVEVRRTSIEAQNYHYLLSQKSVLPW